MNMLVFDMQKWQLAVCRSPGQGFRYLSDELTPVQFFCWHLIRFSTAPDFDLKVSNHLLVKCCWHAPSYFCAGFFGTVEQCQNLH